jgi:hypothetical protein
MSSICNLLPFSVIIIRLSLNISLNTQSALVLVSSYNPTHQVPRRRRPQRSYTCRQPRSVAVGLGGTSQMGYPAPLRVGELLVMHHGREHRHVPDMGRCPIHTRPCGPANSTPCRSSRRSIDAIAVDLEVFEALHEELGPAEHGAAAMAVESTAPVAPRPSCYPLRVPHFLISISPNFPMRIGPNFALRQGAAMRRSCPAMAGPCQTHGPGPWARSTGAGHGPWGF